MKKLFIIIFMLLIFLTPSSVFAQKTISANYSKTDHIATMWDKIGEKAEGFTKFNKKNKFVFNKKVLDKRLSEIVYAVKEDPDRVEETSSRYGTYLNNFKNNWNEYYDKKVVSQMIKEHKTILDSLQKKEKYESGFWLLFQNNLNLLDQLSQKIK